MSTDPAKLFMKTMHDGGDAMWLLLVLTPVAVSRIYRLGVRLREGQVARWTAWMLPPTGLVALGGLGGVMSMKGLRDAFRFGIYDDAGAVLAICTAHAHNAPILALILASALFTVGAAHAHRSSLPRGDPRPRGLVPVIVALFAAGLAWSQDLGPMAIVASLLVAPLGVWRAPSGEGLAAPDARARATPLCMGALGVASAWAASAHLLDRRQILARLALRAAESAGPSGPPTLDHASRLLLPPSFCALALPATLCALVAARFVMGAVAPVVWSGDPDTRRDLATCAAMLALAAALVIAASWPGPMVEGYLRRLPTLPACPLR